eukprot:412123-Rhodomonas_salina.3
MLCQHRDVRTMCIGRSGPEPGGPLNVQRIGKQLECFGAVLLVPSCARSTSGYRIARTGR